MKYLTITDEDRNLLMSASGEFNFEEDVLLHDDIVVYISDKEPIYNDEDGIKFYPEDQTEDKL